MITAKNERPAGAAAAFVEDKASNAPVYVRNLDAVFARGLQSRVWDSAGNDYIDLLADGGALPLGHNHPDVMRRVAAFLSSGQILPGLDTPTPARRALVEQLMRALPPSFAQDAGIQFCGLTASDAVEAMRRLFKAATGRHSLIAFHGACHGLRPGSLSHGGEMHFFPYGQGDSISLSPGQERRIKELQFADGSSVAFARLLDALPRGAAQASDGDDMMLGTPEAERIDARAGDDTLVGARGNDTLQGGAGRNTYRFTSDSDADVIEPTAGEVGLLAFDGPVSVRVDGQDLLLSAGRSSLVRLLGFGADAAIATQWEIDIGNDVPMTLGDFVRRNLLPVGALSERKKSFLDDQVWQWRLSTRLYPAAFTEAYFEYVEGLGFAGKLASDVVQQSIRMDAGQPQALGAYAVILATPHTTTQIAPVYDPSNRIIGYEERTTERYIPYVSATQSSVVGTDESDTIQLNFEMLGTFEGGGWNHGTVGSFRGAIETGGGDDTILAKGSGFAYADTSDADRELGWKSRPAGDSADLRLRDWGVMDLTYQMISFEADFPSNYPMNLVARGSGAWIDVGAGDDEARGTDGNDVVIGGAGNDWLDGMAGADTYLIGVHGEDVDRISDMAAFDGRFGDEQWIGQRLNDQYVQSGHLQSANVDVVEFDASVNLAQLSYQWSEPYDAPFGARFANDAPLKLRNLELYHDGRKFLEIEYELDARSYDYAVSLPGVERFKFADGKEFDLPELLAQLGGPPTDYVPPTVAHPLDDASATEDSPWTYTVPPETFVDPHGQALTLSATMDNGAPLPTWLSFDAKSGRFTGTPANADVGQRPVRVTATSESGLNVGDVFLLTVANVNDAPAAVAPWRETSTHEGEDWNYRIPDRTIVDEDADDRLTWSARMNNGDPLPAWLSFDAATRTFSGIPGASDTGSLDVQIMATDGAGASAFSTLMLRVATVPEALAAYAERPPAAASPEPGPSAAEPAAPAPTIVGTPGFDFLLGTFGNNHLQGLAGTDFLLGGFGDDVLDGGSEADLMWDFAGNDTYIVDNVGDLVFDWFGHDTARSTISYALGWTLEDLELTGTADVNGTGNYRDNMLRGNSAANFLDGRQGADTLAGGRGDDSLRGGEGSDTYLLARGDGRDIITEDDMPEIGVHEIDVDVVAFGPAISADQLWFRRIGSDLEVSIVGTTDMFTVRDWYVDSRHQVEQFRTSDGKLLQHTQVESLVQAMAGFDVPAGAQTAWLANDQNSLSGVIAANWN